MQPSKFVVLSIVDVHVGMHEAGLANFNKDACPKLNGPTTATGIRFSGIWETLKGIDNSAVEEQEHHVGHLKHGTIVRIE